MHSASAKGLRSQPVPCYFGLGSEAMAMSHPGLELAPSHTTAWCQRLSMYSGQVQQQEGGEGTEFNRFLSLVLSSLDYKSD